MILLFRSPHNWFFSLSNTKLTGELNWWIQLDWPDHLQSYLLHGLDRNIIGNGELFVINMQDRVSSLPLPVRPTLHPPLPLPTPAECSFVWEGNASRFAHQNECKFPSYCNLLLHVPCHGWSAAAAITSFRQSSRRRPLDVSNVICSIY